MHIAIPGLEALLELRNTGTVEVTEGDGFTLEALLDDDLMHSYLVTKLGF